MGSVHVSTVHELGRLVDACAVNVFCALRGSLKSSTSPKQFPSIFRLSTPDAMPLGRSIASVWRSADKRATALSKVTARAIAKHLDGFLMLNCKSVLNSSLHQSGCTIAAICISHRLSWLCPLVTSLRLEAKTCSACWLHRALMLLFKHILPRCAVPSAMLCGIAGRKVKG